MEDPRSGLRPGRAGLRRVTLPCAPSVPGANDAAAKRRPLAPLKNDSNDDRAARGAAIGTRPSQTVSFKARETNNAQRNEFFLSAPK